MADLAKLNEFKPEAIEWFLTQTEKEAAHRRNELSRLNSLVIGSTYIGQVFALILGLSGIGGGVFVAVHTDPYLGIALSAITFAVIAAGLMQRTRKRK